MADKKDKISGTSFTIYAKWDMANNQITCTTRILVSNIIYDLQSGITSGRIPSSKVYAIEQKTLGHASSTLNSMVRGKEFKWNKKIYPFEIYLNDPENTALEDLLTAVHFLIED